MVAAAVDQEVAEGRFDAVVEHLKVHPSSFLEAIDILKGKKDKGKNLPSSLLQQDLRKKDDLSAGNGYLEPSSLTSLVQTQQGRMTPLIILLLIPLLFLIPFLLLATKALFSLF